MNALVDQFLDHVSLERGLSPNTRKAYADDLKRFVLFLDRKRIRSFNDVRRKTILDYLMSEKERGMSVNSISRRLVSVKIFFAYLQYESLLAENVAEVMDSPKLWKVLPSVLSLKEVDKMLSVPKGKSRIALRDKAILELLYATGMRVSELVDLKLDDLHFDSGYLRCMGKGSKVRVVPFGGEAAKHLRRYLADSRPEFVNENDDSSLFLTYRRKKFSRKGIWKLIKDCARKAGIKKNVSPHTLRHSFASHMLANGAPLRVIQELLGHSDIATTQVYTHVDQGRLRAVHASFHPRA
jgi:integrase/recombinase XerD